MFLYFGYIFFISLCYPYSISCGPAHTFLSFLYQIGISDLFEITQYALDEIWTRGLSLTKGVRYPCATRAYRSVLHFESLVTKGVLLPSSTQTILNCFRGVLATRAYLSVLHFELFSNQGSAATLLHSNNTQLFSRSPCHKGFFHIFPVKFNIPRSKIFTSQYYEPTRNLFRSFYIAGNRNRTYNLRFTKPLLYRWAMPAREKIV